MDGEPTAIPEQRTPVGVGAAPDRLPRAARVTLSVAALGAAAAVLAFVAALFLTVAPRNTISARHASVISEVVEPEFSQRWQVFAPDPLWSNLQLEVRARLVGRPGGKGAVTDWFNVSAADVAALRSDPAPARRLVNELRNAWNRYWQTHDAKGRATSRSGELTERYLLRLALGRLDGAEIEGTVAAIQVRVLHRMVTPPTWTGEKVPSDPDIRILPWWPVRSSDLPAGASRDLSVVDP